MLSMEEKELEEEEVELLGEMEDVKEVLGEGDEEGAREGRGSSWLLGSLSLGTGMPCLQGMVRNLVSTTASPHLLTNTGPQHASCRRHTAGSRKPDRAGLAEADPANRESDLHFPFLPRAATPSYYLGHLLSFVGCPRVLRVFRVLPEFLPAPAHGG